MQNPSDATYFIYLYVFTCETCNCPRVEFLIAENSPQDGIRQQAAAWTCTNCKSPQYTAGYRSAIYAQELSVKSGTCSQRYTPDILLPD